MCVSSGTRLILTKEFSSTLPVTRGDGTPNYATSDSFLIAVQLHSIIHRLIPPPLLMAQQLLVGKGLLIIETSRSH